MDANVNDVPDAVKQRILALQNRLTNKDSDRANPAAPTDQQSPAAGEENIANLQDQVSAWQKINGTQNTADRQPLASPQANSTQLAPTKEAVGQVQEAHALVLTSPPVMTTETALPVSGGKRSRNANTTATSTAAGSDTEASSKAMRVDMQDTFSKDGYSMNDNGNSHSQLNSSSSRLGLGANSSSARTKPITNWFTNASSSSSANASGGGGGGGVRSPTPNAADGGVGNTSGPTTQQTNGNGAKSSSSAGGRSRRRDGGITLVHNGKECVTVGVNTANAAKEEEKYAVTMINHLKKELEMQRQGRELAEAKANRIDLELRTHGENNQALQERNRKLVTTLQEVYKNAAVQEARRRREVIATDCVRLGKIVTLRMPANKWGEPQLMDVWKEGYGIKDLRMREGVIFKRKTELENRKKALATLQRSTKQSRMKNSDSVQDLMSMSAESSGALSLVEMDIATEQETLRYHSDQIKQEEASVAEERRLLEADTASHQKELKRLKNEDDSDYIRDLKCLHNRYQLQSLLGKGGFSEVWRAVDLVSLHEVAVKVHKLNPGWAEDKKNNYIKHVTREYQIHKEMSHPRIVLLYDVFEIDDNSFATVLEYCTGIDLDEKLKRCRTIPEKDARPILMQIVSGLRYLNTPQTVEVAVAVSNDGNGAAGLGGSVTGNGNGNGGNGGNGGDGTPSSSQSSATALVGADNNNRATGSPNASATTTVVRRKAIIHYDLKPANILFDEFGDAKITDFGLSKVVDDTNSAEGDGASVELTSIGAGTYWYLPPECFITPASATANGNVNSSNQNQHVQGLIKGKGKSSMTPADNSGVYVTPAAPRISSKVDVWSVGVIFYQMLFGKRPFGEGKSQEVILKEGTMLSANQVDFPSNPKVTDEAKEFIRACLAHNQHHRPDVHALSIHPYLSRQKK